MNIEEIFSGGLTPTKWKKLGAYLRRARIHAGIGLRIASQDESGTILSAVRRPGGNGGGNSCRFKVTYNPASQRLYVGEGSVYSAKVDELKQSMKPHIPVLNAVSLTEKPYWDVSGKSPNVLYNVWCVIKNYYTSRMILLEDSETLELDQDEENAVLVAAITFSAGEEGLVADPLEQIWFSDIPWYFDTSAGDSSDSDESNGSDDSEGSDSIGDSGSGDIEESDNSDDSSDSSDESSSSGCACVFPAVSGFTVELVEVDGSVDTSCMMEDEFNAPVLRPVKIKLSATLDSGVCDDCQGFVDMVFSIGGRSKSQNVGSGSLGAGEYTDQIEFNGFPCTEYTGSVKLVARSSGSIADDCCLTGSTPKIEDVITLPGLCSNFGSCE